MAISGGWNRRVKLAIDKDLVPEDQSNFPVALVWNGSSGNLPSEVYNNSSSSPMPDGRDIRFSIDQNGSQEMAFEIVTFTPNSTVANARVEIYAEVLRLYSSVDTTFFMWYDNKNVSAYANTDTYGRNKVWEHHFVGVYHMDGTGNLVNATGNSAYDGTDYGSDSTFTALGTARYFNATTHNYIEIEGLMGQPAAITISSIINAVGTSSGGAEVYSVGDCFATRVVDGTVYGFYRYASGWRNTLLSVGYPFFNQSHSLSYTSDPAGAYQAVYFDGTMYTDTTYSDALVYAQGPNTQISRHGDGQTAFDYTGVIDEIRVSDSTRNASWVTVTHNSLTSFSDFITPEAVENVNFLELMCNF